MQDKDSTKAAASMAVNAGHFDDPADRQGLAHFLEHMLFLGTDQFPDSGSFNNFVSQAGGNTNAWTGTEHSCYFFDINNQEFEHALLQFSRFFIAPLLSANETEKERNAIDAEFKLKIRTMPVAFIRPIKKRLTLRILSLSFLLVTCKHSQTESAALATNFVTFLMSITKHNG